MSDTEDFVAVKIYIVRVGGPTEDRFHVMLEHSDGTQEISAQHYPSRVLCEAAIEAYAKERMADIQRVQ